MRNALLHWFWKFHAKILNINKNPTLGNSQPAIWPILSIFCCFSGLKSKFLLILSYTWFMSHPKNIDITHPFLAISKISCSRDYLQLKRTPTSLLLGMLKKFDIFRPKWTWTPPNFGPRSYFLSKLLSRNQDSQKDHAEPHNHVLAKSILVFCVIPGPRDQSFFRWYSKLIVQHQCTVFFPTFWQIIFG